MKKWMLMIVLVFGGVWGAAGCGTVETRMTVEQLTHARVAVEAAERVDAKKLSPESLRHAQDALAIANDAYANQEIERAFSFAKRATIYARVAKAQSEQKQDEEKYLTSKNQLEALRKQIEAEVTAGAPDMPAPPAQPAVPEAPPTAVPTTAPAENGTPIVTEGKTL